MSILIPGTEQGVYQEPETPMTYNQELEAWEKTSGYEFDADAQAWEERWNSQYVLFDNGKSYIPFTAYSMGSDPNNSYHGTGYATCTYESNYMQWYSHGGTKNGHSSLISSEKIRRGNRTKARVLFTSYTTNYDCLIRFDVWSDMVATGTYTLYNFVGPSGTFLTSWEGLMCGNDNNNNNSYYASSLTEIVVDISNLGDEIVVGAILYQCNSNTVWARIQKLWLE